jgi:predicted ATP-dependent serine protease
MLAVEEHTTDIRMRCEMFNMTRHDPVTFYVGDLGHDEQTMRDLTSLIQRKGIGLVVLDTLGHHIAGELESENDSMGAIKALKPWLHLARQTNAAVLVIHHTGKGGASYRGSSGFGGIVDQILTLRNAGGNWRDLESRGRYWETPRHLRMILEGTTYRVIPA